ncbi:Adenosine kinase 2 [Halotydeus destructor]|nr:Adenosine kinase 2 [Halotydeus destructor]
MAAQGVLLGFGHPLLDISAEVSNEFLAKFKLEPDNVILGGPDQETLIRELTTDYRVRYSAGGATQNAVRIAQWILRRPFCATFVGSVGLDRFGEILKEQTELDGVLTGYYVDKTMSTGLCAVLITHGGCHRSLVSFIGAANTFKRPHMLSKWPLVSQAKVYYCAGFTIRSAFDAVLELATHARQVSGKLFAFNLSAPYICQHFTEKLMQLMPMVDILFGNESEAQALSKALNWQETDLHKLAARLYQVPSKSPTGRVVLITRGDGPVVVASKGQSKGPLITEYPVPAVPKERIIDTNAAGDGFVGGFLAQWIRKRPLDLCVKTGIYAAGRIIQVNGCDLATFGLFDEEKV